MRFFMDFNENYAERVLVLERPYSDYAFNPKTGEPNEIVRVADGPLAGREGYLTRFRGERRLVFNMKSPTGGASFAVSIPDVWNFRVVRLHNAEGDRLTRATEKRARSRPTHRLAARQRHGRRCAPHVPRHGRGAGCQAIAARPLPLAALPGPRRHSRTPGHAHCRRGRAAGKPRPLRARQPGLHPQRIPTPRHAPFPHAHAGRRHRRGSRRGTDSPRSLHRSDTQGLHSRAGILPEQAAGRSRHHHILRPHRHHAHTTIARRRRTDSPTMAQHPLTTGESRRGASPSSPTGMPFSASTSSPQARQTRSLSAEQSARRQATMPQVREAGGCSTHSATTPLRSTRCSPTPLRQ